MALASYSSLPPNPQPKRSNRPVNRRYKSKAIPQPHKAKVYTLPASHTQSLPPKLQFILMLQKTFSVFTFMLVAITLAAYAWTVYAPKQWNREYRKLEALQRHERHLNATNETLKNQLADQAEKPNSGFSKANPSHNLFIRVKPVPSSSSTQPPQIEPEPIITYPLAY